MATRICDKTPESPGSLTRYSPNTAKNGPFLGIFGIMGPKGDPVGSENLKNGLAMHKNPYFDPSHVSELPLGAKR